MRRFVVPLVVVLGLGTAAIADYTATPGVGLAFGSRVVNGVHHTRMVFCDFAAPAVNCAAVSSIGAVKVDNDPPRAARNFPGCNVTTASGQCLAANTATRFLQVQNAGTGAIACAFGASAGLNAAGSFHLAAGQSASWGPNTGGVPTGALNCIAAAATPLYLEWL